MNPATDMGTDVPETIAMAREWDRRAAAYRRAGLCASCASSASWGHALGWHRAPHPPCASCVSVVAAFPDATVHTAWRQWPRGRASVASRRSSHLSGVVSCAKAADLLLGRGEELQ